MNVSKSVDIEVARQLILRMPRGLNWCRLWMPSIHGFFCKFPHRVFNISLRSRSISAFLMKKTSIGQFGSRSPFMVWWSLAALVKWKKASADRKALSAVPLSRWRVARDFTAAPMPSTGPFPWEVVEKVHTAGSPKSNSWYVRLSIFLPFLKCELAPSLT